MKINDDERNEVWVEYENLEFKLRELKGIVQNPIKLTEKDLENHSRFTDDLIRRLGTLNRYICDRALNSKND